MFTCAVRENGREMGTLQWACDGLRWTFTAELLSYGGIRKLTAYDADGRALALGTPSPSGGRMRLRRTFSATQLAWDGMRLETLTAELTDIGRAVQSPLRPVSREREEWRADGEYGGVCGLLRRERDGALAETFDPKRPMTFACRFTKVRLETIGGRRCWVLTR